MSSFLLIFLWHQSWVFSRIQYLKILLIIYCFFDRIGRSLIGSRLNHGKRVLKDSVEHIRRDFKLIVPARSAPTVRFSSPPLSPQRLITGDTFPSPYVSYQGLRVWSAPEFPASDTAFFAQTSPKRHLTGPDCSQISRLIGKSPGMKPKNHSGPTSPLHSRMSRQRSSTCHGKGTVSVHPLPLPPGAAMPSQPAFIHQTPSKSEVSSMKSQWQKGKLIGCGTFGNVYVATNRYARFWSISLFYFLLR